MALNPVVYTEKVTGNFLRYQLTRHPFTDQNLYEQMKRLLSLEETRNSSLLKGPYISLSKAFRQGKAVRDLVSGGIFHPHMANLVEYQHLYGHQEKAIRSIFEGMTTLISTGTGSGKTECFLYPIVSHCLNLRDRKEAPGITAVIVYPMNALAEDQLGRMREFLAGSGITFGMYVGKTPENRENVTGTFLKPNSSRADYQKEIQKAKQENRETAVHPPEEVCSRDEMRATPPRILLTNVKQLELLLTRNKDIDLFNNARLEFLVFDEAHTYSGANGAETACLIRRLRVFCGSENLHTKCIATSATIADPEDNNSGAVFASRFFGVPEDKVNLISEEYTGDTWAEKRKIPRAFPSNRADTLQQVLNAVDPGNYDDVNRIFNYITGENLDTEDWEGSLYNALIENETVYQISRLLDTPKDISVLREELTPLLNYSISEEELLVWLAFGTAAKRNGRSLLRPVIHAFIRGIAGAVVTFPPREKTKLWLSAESCIKANENSDEKLVHLSVLNCSRCGQHYFEHFLEDFEFTGKLPGGGRASSEGGRYWPPLDAALGGKRVILFDTVISGEEEQNQNTTSTVYLCRFCGTVHPANVSFCAGCGRPDSCVNLYVYKPKADFPEKLSTCVACDAEGSDRSTGYREPIKMIKAVPVADVHILAQDMVHHADRKRLLLFCDNRQDAAFQAGWMRDHARKFRLRALMYEFIKNGDISIGDLTAKLDDLLDNDDSLSMALIPEVWLVARKESSGTRHQDERKLFLRMQILQELTSSVRLPIGLEPWGRLKIKYQGLSDSLPFIQLKAHEMAIPAEELSNGISALLDYIRRASHLVYDPVAEVYSKIWADGDKEIQRGYLNIIKGIPFGLKYAKNPDDAQRVKPWMSTGLNAIKETIRKWGIKQDKEEQFLKELWDFLTSTIKIFIPVTLRGSRNNALPNCSGTYQIDSDKLIISPNRGYYRCRTCRRTQVRKSIDSACTGWRCSGEMEYVSENPDNYDLQLLDSSYEMIKPREHSAQVPADEREKLEHKFKSDSSTEINTLVCTPTLEMGIDIGALDTVLMRNVPPHPANYWQRVGRAGRRHRVAVNITYVRPVSHDQVFFQDPLKILEGRVEPPGFNLSNELMLRKHIHSSILTYLNWKIRHSSETPAEEKKRIASVLSGIFPIYVKHYLFDSSGNLLQEEYDISEFMELIARYSPGILGHIKELFATGWPQSDSALVKEEKLIEYINQTPEMLAEVIRRLKKRLNWALLQINRLAEIRRVKGTLDPEDDALHNRCDAIVKRLKGQTRRNASETEGYDDTQTFAVLAAEGFFPGYGLETGSLVGNAVVPKYLNNARDYSLRRPTALALREFIPGNLLYANTHIFTPRHFHLEAEKPLLFQIDAANEAVVELGEKNRNSSRTTSVGAQFLTAVKICDSELAHFSHIKDEEEFRFRMGVAVYGYEQNRHNGGIAYTWGIKDLLFRKSVHMRQLNAGASRLIRASNSFGYPVCLVCGKSRSPLSSEREIESFIEHHHELCGKIPEFIGFYADIIADSITLKSCADREEAYSVLEAIRTGAAEILDMEQTDLSIIVIGKPGQDDVDAVLFDPMPGGSGLLEQIILRFDEISAKAIELLENCPSDCGRACVDCLMVYENSYYHQHLSRHKAVEMLRSWGSSLCKSHDIPEKMPQNEPTQDEIPVNLAEQALRFMLLNAGFPEPQWHCRIKVIPPYKFTEPDCFYEGEDADDRGICIYLDGLSKHIHGNKDTFKKDMDIRTYLRNEGYEVIEIPASQLADKESMARHFFKLGRLLVGKDKARNIKESCEKWHIDPYSMSEKINLESEVSDVNLQVPFTEVPINNVIPFKNAIPLVPLKAAAGVFGDIFDVKEQTWVKPNTFKKLEKGMFIAQVVGKSMEPKIPDGAYCLFKGPVEGSRTGRDLLMQHRSITDPDHGGSYTVKRFDSGKVTGKLTLNRKGTIFLRPLNHEYEPIIFEDENEIRVIAEVIEVLG